MKLFIQKIIYKIKANKQLSLAVLVAVLMLIAVGSFLLMNKQQSGTTSQSPTKSKPTFANYLKPTSEIKVGDNRYVSPCQVLTLEDVNSIFGNIGDEGYIDENYYDANVVPLRSLDRDIETSCRYRYQDKKEVSLEARQSFKAVNTGDLRFTLYSLGADQMPGKIKQFEKATANSGDDVKAFVAILKRSADIYDKQKTSKSDEPVNTDGLVFPVDRELFSFNVVEGNVVYKLDFKVKEKAKDEASLSDQEIADNLSKSARAIEVIREKAANAHLDQSPSPTILGDTEMVGSTKVLESCAVLTSQLYQAVIGSPANKEIGRKSVPQNITKEQFALNGSPLLPDNQCERNGKAGDTSTVVRLELNFARSSDELQTILSKGYKIDGNDKILQSNADWAGYFEYGGGTGGGYGVFRVGTYYGTVDILNTTSSGLFSDITQTRAGEQQLLQLINAAADSIKQYSK